MKPALARARAPVNRLAVLESFGRLDVVTPVAAASLPIRPPPAISEGDGAGAGIRATYSRSWFSMPKYSALPAPVRITDGVVPRHNERIGLGPFRISRRARDKDEVWDCWTRVFKRSAGWRRKAVETPEERPARKWNAVRQDHRN